MSRKTTTTTTFEPGLVKIHGLLSVEEQIELALRILACGNNTEYGFWETDMEGNRKLNSTQTRGRIYQAIGKYEDSMAECLRDLGDRAHRIACENDKDMPSFEDKPCTHALLLYYSQNRGLQEHRDNGANDGTGNQPIISINLGKAIDFSVRHEKGDDKRVIRLDSGDAVLFGGPCRMLLHSVKIFGGTNPLVGHGLPDVRLNVTLRCSPEVLGREEEFRYFKPATRKRKDNKTKDEDSGSLKKNK